MIRRATLEDLDCLEAIEETCFPGREFSRSALSWFLTSRRSVAYVLEEDSQVIGSGMASVSGEVGTIGSVAVFPEHRRRGHGRDLMETLEETCLRLGATVLRLQVDVKNDAAIVLYESMGYERGRTLPDYYGPRDDALVMTKALGAGREARLDPGRQGMALDADGAFK